MLFLVRSFLDEIGDLLEVNAERNEEIKTKEATEQCPWYMLFQSGNSVVGT
jgi:hypothetical protein